MILARQLSELSAMPMLLVDRSGTVVHGNESAAALLGGDALVGNPTWAAFVGRVRVAEGGGDDLPPVEQLLEAAPFCRRVRFRSREGETVCSTMLGVPLIGLADTRDGVLIVLGEGDCAPGGRSS